MPISTDIRFKVATQAAEFEQIAQLNYRTFVEEIPQHPPAESGMLVDQFHKENSYVIGEDADRRVVAMVAVRDRRPFSLDRKLPQLDRYLPPGRRMCEIRLLAVEPGRRRSRITAGLMRALTRHCVGKGYDLAIISGTLRQLRLYRRLGFIPFGPVVGSEAAPYQPMYLPVERFRHVAPPLLTSVNRSQPRINFLPGPVDISPQVKRAFARPAISHRGRAFARRLSTVRQRLCELAQANHVQLLAGPGTMANDAVAAQLSLRDDHGIVLSQGEFGERLVDHARRFGLDTAVVRESSDRPIPESAIEDVLSKHPNCGWLWAVHCETSSGVMTDLPMLKRLCQRHRMDLCVDCISSIGTIPLDLRGVRFATASSGKGLASRAGLAMVFHDSTVMPSTRLPRSLDLGLYEQSAGVPFTLPSHALAALAAALEEMQPARFETIAQLGTMLKQRLIELDLSPIGPPGFTSPAVTTVVLPRPFRSLRFGRELEAAGVRAAYRSAYLHRRNAVQFCLMGHPTRQQIDDLLNAIRRLQQSTMCTGINPAPEPATGFRL